MLGSHPLQLFISLAAFLVNVVVQFFSFRVRHKLLVSQAVGVLLGALFLWTSEWMMARWGLSFDLGRLAADILLYFCFCYGYFHFLNLGETARRIRILRELDESGPGLTAQEICQRYSAREIIDRRLDRLIAAGQIVPRDGRYFVKSPILLGMANILVYLKRFLLSGPKVHKQQ